MLFALLLPLSERLLRGRARYSDTPDGPGAVPHPLRGLAAFGAFAACAGLFVISFLLPAIQLLVWALEVYKESGWEYGNLLGRTVALASMVMAIGVPLCLATVFWARLKRTVYTNILPRLLSIGYAVPGTVLAAGVVSISGLLVTWVAGIDSGWTKVFLPGSLALLVVACLSRFAALAIGSMHTGLSRIRRPMIEAASLLGLTRLQTVWRVYLPLLVPAVGTAALLLFIETAREMPITLMLRPFGWDTLAVRIFELSSEGEWSRAAIPSLLVMLVGLVPVMLIVRRRYPVTNRKSNDA
jgi:iron(III) transport system permease protein